MIHYLPLTGDLAYCERVIATAAARGVDAIQLSHRLCHNVDDLLHDPERAGRVAQVVAAAQAAGLAVWCWTHEFVEPPAAFLDPDDRLRCDEPGLGDHLEAKYAHLCRAVLPGLTGIVLTFAECPYPVYQDRRVVSDHTRIERTRRLVEQMHAALVPHGVRLAVRDFVYRRDEVEAMRAAIDALPKDIIVMSKAVPHDWHPDYPGNPLIGAFAGREQWVEHDLGFEYEGQHILPYANLATIAGRIGEERRRGAAAWCLRLDRYSGDRGHGALDSPWGGLALDVAETAAAGGDVATAQRDWEAAQFPGAAAWLREASDCVRRTLFPRGQWYANHSNLPTYGYARGHLTGGNADRLAAWSDEVADAFNEGAMASMPPGWCAAMIAEGDAEADRAEALRNQLLVQGDLGPQVEQWRCGAEQLVMWTSLFAAHRQVYFRIREAETRPTATDDRDIAAAIAELEDRARGYSPLARDLRIEDRRPDARDADAHDRDAPYPLPPQPQAWQNVIASLRAAAQRLV